MAKAKKFKVGDGGWTQKEIDKAAFKKDCKDFDETVKDKGSSTWYAYTSFGVQSFEEQLIDIQRERNLIIARKGTWVVIAICISAMLIASVIHT